MFSRMTVEELRALLGFHILMAMHGLPTWVLISEFEFEFEFGVRDGDHLALRTCAIATCACVSPVRQELGFWL